MRPTVRLLGLILFAAGCWSASAQWTPTKDSARLWLLLGDLEKIELAIRSYRDLCGSYPATVPPAALKQIDTSAYSQLCGEQFIYHVQDDRFDVYSPGANRKDDRGGKDDIKSGKDPSPFYYKTYTVSTKGLIVASLAILAGIVLLAVPIGEGRSGLTGKT